MFGEADLARKTSLIFEALQGFSEHAQCAPLAELQSGAAQRSSHTEHSLRVRAVDLQLAVRTTDATLLLLFIAAIHLPISFFVFFKYPELCVNPLFKVLIFLLKASSFFRKQKLEAGPF